MEGNEDAAVQKSSCEEDASETDPTQVGHSLYTVCKCYRCCKDSLTCDLVKSMVYPQTDAQLIQTGNTPDDVDVQTSLREQEPHESRQTDEQPADEQQSDTVEAEACRSSQTVAACADLQAETRRDGPQITDSPQKQSFSGGSPPARPESTPKPSSSKKPKEKQKASPAPEQPPRRVTRRQLELEPYGKKLRSSSTQEGQSTSSPEPLTRAKSAVKSALQKDTSTEQPPPKKARGKTAAAESDEEPNPPAAVSETARAGLS